MKLASLCLAVEVGGGSVVVLATRKAGSDLPNKKRKFNNSHTGINDTIELIKITIYLPCLDFVLFQLYSHP